MTYPSWPDDHVERLKVLWAEGQSATQISTRLRAEFGPVAMYSRNAVMGKKDRMGLGGRAASQVQRRTYPKAPTRQVMPKGVGAFILPKLGTGGSGLEKSVEAAKANAIAKAAALTCDAPSTPEAAGRRTSLTLCAHECKWPVGDPQHPAFSFCGVKHDQAGPYCVKHARKAYQGAPVRKRLDERLGITPGRRTA